MEKTEAVHGHGACSPQGGAPRQRGLRPSAGSVPRSLARRRAHHSPRSQKETGMQGFSRRDFLKGTAAAGVGAAAGLGFPAVLRAQGGGTVKVGVLHSLSGTMAISEVSLRDVCMMAFDEINAKGGVMGKKIEPVVVDPASNWDLFAEKAKQLLLQDKVSVVFGCWTSVSRKSVLPVFENNNGLLFYPVQYEGEECSKNVFYTGATPNQQLIRAAEHMMSKEGGGDKNYYQVVDTPQNKKFVQAFKAYAKKNNLPGGDKRVTDDPMEAAYFGVYVWKQAAEKAKSFEVDAVRKAVYGQTFLAPGGQIKMDEANHHTYKPVLIGEILKDGQFKIVSRSKGLVRAEPWSKYTSPAKGCDWVKEKGTYQKKA